MKNSLKRLRERAKLTQKELVTKTGLSVKIISELEKIPITKTILKEKRSEIEKYLTGLNISISEFLLENLEESDIKSEMREHWKKVKPHVTKLLKTISEAL